MTEPPLVSSPYSRSPAWRRPLCGIAAAALAAVALSACSISMPLGGIGGQEHEPAVTGSIAPTAAAPVGNVDSAPLPALPAKTAAGTTPTPSGTATAFAATGAAGSAFNPADWVYARGALGLALSGTAGGPPVPWANPETGTYGSFAPTAPATVESGVTCRNFIAERVKAEAKQRFNGQACRDDSGAWDIARLTTAPATL